jgi:hypothetical protein
VKEEDDAAEDPVDDREDGVQCQILKVWFFITKICLSNMFKLQSKLH